MAYLFLMLGVSLLLPLLRLAFRLRLGLPLLFSLGMLTVCHSWYQAHTALADVIFLAQERAMCWLTGWPELPWPAVCGRPELRGAPWWTPRACDQPRPISSRMSRSLILIAPTSTNILNTSSPT